MDKWTPESDRYFREGQDAYRDRKKKDENPYRKNGESPEEREIGAEVHWDLGWDQEEKDLRGYD